MNCDVNLGEALPCCSTTIEIGTLADPKSNIYLTFENLATGNRITKQVSSDGDGKVTVDPDWSFPIDQTFDIYLQEDIGNDDRLPFTTKGGSAPVYFVRTMFYNNSIDVLKAYLQLT